VASLSDGEYAEGYMEGHTQGYSQNDASENNLDSVYATPMYDNMDAYPVDEFADPVYTYADEPDDVASITSIQAPPGPGPHKPSAYQPGPDTIEPGGAGHALVLAVPDGNADDTGSLLSLELDNVAPIHFEEDPSGEPYYIYIYILYYAA
jgi:hypothetical protein